MSKNRFEPGDKVEVVDSDLDGNDYSGYIGYINNIYFKSCNDEIDFTYEVQLVKSPAGKSYITSSIDDGYSIKSRSLDMHNMSTYTDRVYIRDLERNPIAIACSGNNLKLIAKVI